MLQYSNPAGQRLPNGQGWLLSGLAFFSFPMPALPTPQSAAERDQYFTSPEAVALCMEAFLPLVERAFQAPVNQVWFVEPSAGNGAFLEALAQAGLSAWGGDIEPQHPRVEHHDFLAQPSPDRPSSLGHTAVIGNPPFGKKATLAVAFVNKALSMAPLVGFVVPLQLRKWSAQKGISTNARLLLDETLPESSFLFLGKPYKLRCCFQVWTTLEEVELSGTNLRLQQAPATQHPDFSAWQFNCTPEALKYFDYNWDFAVLRQGFGDFSHQHSPRERDALDRRKQWIFIKANTPEALALLRSIDYQALARRNSGTLGFGKADLVQAYVALKDPVA